MAKLQPRQEIRLREGHIHVDGQEYICLDLNLEGDKNHHTGGVF